MTKTFDGLIEAISNSGRLDGKTKQLIYIAMRTSTGDVAAARLYSTKVWL